MVAIMPNVAHEWGLKGATSIPSKVFSLKGKLKDEKGIVATKFDMELDVDSGWQGMKLG